MSKPASVTSYEQESIRDESTEAAKIPLKAKGLDIASQMQSVKQAEPDLAGAVGDYSTSVAQTLGVIEAIEATLQQKRRQIEEIQARQEVLAREYRQLGETLDTATKDLAEEFIDIIADLESGEFIAASESAPTPTQETDATIATNGSDLAPPRQQAPEASPSGIEALAEMTTDTNGAESERPAEKIAETGNDLSEEEAQEAERALDLDLEIADLPPVPEFLGGSQEVADKPDDSALPDIGASSRPWWKHGKKG